MSYNRERDHRCFKRPRLPSGIIFGLFLIYLGLAFALKNLNLIYIEDVLLYCPCFLIALGLARLWNRGVFNFWGQIFLSCGILLQTAFLLDLDVIGIWWPAIIVWLGIIVVLRAFMPKKNHLNIRLIPSQERHWQRHGDMDKPSLTVENKD
ncbi:MAG: DUF5668 domain-containing protein [Holophagales bacterium]|nr:DUF5668 domain-containing protein [Holophagales bacterium]